MGKPTSEPCRPSMYCRECQYVLDGLPENRCPECGTSYDPLDASSYLTGLGAKWWSIRWEAKAAVGCALTFFAALPRGRRPWMAPDFIHVLCCIAIAFAIGFALSAARRGSKLSRILGAVQLITYACMAVCLFSGYFGITYAR